MSYKCPKCGGIVQRGYNSKAQATAGLVGLLFYMAFGSFQCKKCGKISRGEFSSTDQTKMMIGSVLMTIIALLLVYVFVMYLVSR